MSLGVFPGTRHFFRRRTKRFIRPISLFTQLCPLTQGICIAKQTCEVAARVLECQPPPGGYLILSINVSSIETKPAHKEVHDGRDH